LPDYKHLHCLDSVWIEPAIYFITICTASRRQALARPDVLAILRDEFSTAPRRYGWSVGRFVAMPDHLHFFCAGGEAAGAASLSRFIGGFKQWTAKRILQLDGAPAPFWQKEFFDHLLRSQESYDAKWLYARENPVRAGLVEKVDNWPFGGEIEILLR
jgi:REP-associated tyrosine transposase